MSHQLINDPAWVKRMEQYFGSIDEDNNGRIAIEEIQQWATNVEVRYKATPNKMVKLRAHLYTFWGKIGLKSDVLMNKKQFIEGVNKLGNVEVKRNRNGYITFLEMVSHALYDIVDTENIGFLKLEELKSVMMANSMKPHGENTWLEQLDIYKNGTIDREDFLALQHTFWYEAKGV